MTAPITEKRLLDAIAVVSEVILLHGAKYAPLLDRLEQELDALRSYESPVVRAQRHLAQRQSQSIGV
ncbi:hypothetical protein [Bradyrhizobium sp. NAS96.2]|uniref:hypothetical protein n=1 Tax=Bradyrhizobium sp. NAS96.2 TaxID=1680160 RepID=UPI00093FCCA9|nr:hypothetical protein [Bradyrhizobium sp. NAS96.2]OKO73612.1 hypothetical protein AC628_23945 [Bradyrhizobium sp. NAS96.2]